ncbi:hypothetical protein PFISCL1PPCAC_14637, partial [Pristionchus fissidentatus]
FYFQMADDDEKYAYLLQPIKDLQKNWDMDLEDILGKYLQQLSDIADQEELGLQKKHAVDFAEASRVIQGSATIYGRKVDFVYDDVIAFRNMLSTNKGKGKGKKNAAEDEEEDDGIDPIDTVPSDSFVLIDYSKSKRSDMASLCIKNGVKRVLTVPLMPMSLMPLADFEKCNVPMYARKKSKEVIGKKDDFKMNSAYISEEGAILLDLMNRNLIGKFSRLIDEENMPPPPSRNFSRLTNTQPPLSQPFASQAFASQSFNSNGTTEADLEVGAMMRGRMSSLNPVEGIREGSMSRDCISTMDERRKTEVIRPSTRFNMSIVNEANEDDFGGGGGFDDSMGGGMDNMENDENEQSRREEKRNPWDENDLEEDPVHNMMADPYAELKWRRKPLVLVKSRLNTKKILANIKKARAAMTPRQRAMETLDYLNEFVFCKVVKKKKKFREDEDNWSKMVLAPFVARMKKAREQEEKKRRKKIVLTQKTTQSQPTMVEEEYVYDGADDDDDYDNFGGGMDYSDGGIHDGMNDEPIHTSSPLKRREEEEKEKGPNDYGMDEREMRSRGGLAVLDPDDYYLHSAGDVFDSIEGTNQIFWEDPEEAEKRSQMRTRIEEWGKKVIPLLDEEEGFKEFDIHHYGNTMLQVFDDVGEQRLLSHMVAGCHIREVSRYMLSVLMMANTYNVEVDYNDNADEVVPMKVSLLKRERHHEVFNQEDGFV